MAVPQELLQRLAAILRITRVDPPLAQLGQFMRFGIGPDPGLLRAVDPDLVTRNLALVLDAALRGTAVASTADTTGTMTDAIGNVLNTINATTQPVTSEISTTVEGASPGSPASLAGSLPIPVEVPVQLSVKWGAYRYVPSAVGGRGPLAGALLPPRPVNSTARLAAAFAESEPSDDFDLSAVDMVNFVREELTLGQDFLAPGGLDVMEVAFLFAPPFGELTLRPPQTRQIYVYVAVTLTVPGQTYGPFELSVKVLLPVLPIPKLLALFRHREFNFETERGMPLNGPAILLVAPIDSPLGGLEELRLILTTLGSALAPLRILTRFAKLLLGVNLLATALSRTPRVRFAIADRIDDLHVIRLIRKPAWEDPYVADVIRDLRKWPGDNSTNDIYAADEMSSMILLGPPDTTAECFIVRDCLEQHGRLIVTTGPEAVVMIPSLDYAGATAPTTNPADRAHVDPQPYQGNSSFNDEISSLRF